MECCKDFENCYALSCFSRREYKNKELVKELKVLDVDLDVLGEIFNFLYSYMFEQEKYSNANGLDLKNAFFHMAQKILAKMKEDGVVPSHYDYFWL